jgi:hypothetical protein
MSRIIIENRTDILTDFECMSYIQNVIDMGRISNNDKQYCYLTTFKTPKGKIAVSTTLNKSSDKFVISNY